MNANQKLPYYAIGKGVMHTAMQDVFEETSQFVNGTGRAAEITLKIKIEPPEYGNEDYGKTAFSIGVSKAPYKSQKFTTNIQDGLIVSTGLDDADAMQLDLDFKKPENTVELPKVAGEAS